MANIDHVKVAQQLFQLQNGLRDNPQSIIPDLEARLQNVSGRIVTLPNGHQLRTREGAAAIEECIGFLRRQQPFYPLTWEPMLSRAALDHANDIGKQGIISHQGSDGSTLKQRVERYGKWKQLLGENMSFGVYDPKEVMLQLIIDDGVQGRGHRNNVFTAAFTVVGIAFTNHSKYQICGVLDYAGQFIEDQSKLGQQVIPQNPPITIPQSPPSQQIPKIVFNATPKPQSAHKSVTPAKSTPTKVEKIDFNSLLPKRVEQSPGSNHFESQVKEMERDGKCVNQDIVKTLVHDELMNLKHNLNSKQDPQSHLSQQTNLSQQSPQTQYLSQQSPQYEHFQSFSIPKFDDRTPTLFEGSPSSQYRSPQKPQAPLLKPKRSSGGKSSDINSLLDNFMEKRHQRQELPTPDSLNLSLMQDPPRYRNDSTNQKIQFSPDTSSMYQKYSIVQPSENSSLLVENAGIQSRQSEVISSFLKDALNEPDLDSLIDKLYLQAISKKRYARIEKPTPQASTPKLTKRTESSKGSRPEMPKERSPKSIQREISNPYMKNDKLKSLVHKVQTVNMISKLVTKHDAISGQPKVDDPPTPEIKPKSEVTKDQKQPSKGSLTVPEVKTQPQSTRRLLKPVKPIPQFPIMNVSKYLFGNELLLGPHRVRDLQKSTEQEIIKYYSQFKSTQTITNPEELLQSYQYDTYLLFMVKQEAQFLQLCQENYSLFLRGNLDKDRRKWTSTYMPKEHLIPYLRSLGFLIDQKGAETLFKLVQAYYQGQVKSLPQGKKPPPPATTKQSKRISKSESLNSLERTNQYNFEGALLGVLACSCLYPNPSSLRESLAFFDERKNGTLDKVKTKEILTSVGEGVSNEEIGLFYEEFQDWKLYEQQRQQAQQLKKKGIKSKAKQQVEVLKDFALVDALKVLTMLPY